MKPFSFKGIRSLKGTITNLPGDKSISHRAVILSSIAKSKTSIYNFPFNDDCLSTISAFKQLGVKIIQEKINNKPRILIYGRGLKGLKKPKKNIYLGESGTTLRLLLGILSGQDFKARLISGKSLSRRPMLRVTKPLRMMGADIKSTLRQAEEYPPITITGGSIKPIIYKMPVASAQVKSAILLAGLYADGLTIVKEPVKTRDHTERMLKLFKADIKTTGNTIKIKGGRELVSPKNIFIPADISSASFFIVAASILPKAKVVIKNVSLNPGRIGVIKVLKRMGADIKCRAANIHYQKYEPMGNIAVKNSRLKGTVIRKEEVPSLIDELPILMVAACLASGKVIFKGVGELRVKETDRIKSMLVNLAKMGAKIKVSGKPGAENIIVEGAKSLKGAKLKSFGDHRTAMSMIIAGLKAVGTTRIDDISCINKSFPDFLHILNSLKA